jgi:hypothetical protein
VRGSVGERERGAPGAAEEHRALEPESAAQGFDVLDQARRGVLLDRPARSRAATAALVEEHHAVEPRIEESPVHRPHLAAGTAVEEEHREPGGVAALLNVERMAPAHRQLLLRKGLKRRIESRVGGIHAGPLSAAAS